MSPDHLDDELAELMGALAKIDAAVAQAVARAGDALTCARGCARCCVGGLSVLPVEAALIARSGLAPPTHSAAGMCAFLDERGDCSIYPVRPVLCRTHGLALKTEPDRARAGGLRVLGDDVEVCALNYQARAPAPAEVLDATRVLMLLVTVDRRYRARVGLPDDDARVALADLADDLRAG